MYANFGGDSTSSAQKPALISSSKVRFLQHLPLDDVFSVAVVLVT